MSILQYSSSRIQFVPNNREPPRDYSERSLVELREMDNGNYGIRALDIENNKTEIFYIPLTNRDQYQVARSRDLPDQMKTSNGTYHLWLKQELRDGFHEILYAVLEMLFPEELTDSESYLHSDSDPDIPFVTTSPFQSKTSEKTEVSIPDSAYCNPKDILTDVHNLNKFIKQGRADEAAKLATELVSKGVRLEAQPLEQGRYEEEFPITIQFDGNEYGINQNGGNIPVNVFPSTTIRELRAAFEVGYHCPPTSQYFFVNGKLAHDEQAMKDLHVGPNSLFVLFLLGHSRQFKTNDPWKCSACRTQNSSDSLKCQTCWASRIE